MKSYPNLKVLCYMKALRSDLNKKAYSMFKTIVAKHEKDGSLADTIVSQALEEQLGYERAGDEMTRQVLGSLAPAPPPACSQPDKGSRGGGKSN